MTTPSVLTTIVASCNKKAYLWGCSY